jgi:probable rRNA maturation factor
MSELYLNITRSRTGLGYPQTARYVKKAIAATLSAEGVDTPCAVEVLLTDDATIHEINREHRSVDRPTDVLSFPLNELTPGAFDAELCEYDYERGCVLLGDMVVSMERCAEQAAAFGHSFQHEVTYLAVHSTLHLLGYDHVDEGDMKKQMRTREKAILNMLGENDL